MGRDTQTIIRFTTLAAAAAGLSACATPAPPPPPPPPPPVVEAVPYRPIPPNQAAYVMEIPRVGPDGVRMTPNVGITDDQKVWYFRSAWNVAALNCLGPVNQPTLDGYSKFIKTHAKQLKSANDRIDAAYAKTAATKRDAIKQREAKMTLVYNFFALPAARGEFCQAALDVANRYNAGGVSDGAAFALANFAVLQQPFENFFRAYEQYQQASAAWDARYGATYGASQPGYVAVQRTRAAAIPAPGTSAPAQLTIDPNVRQTTVTDQATGAQIPVVPVDTTRQSTPVVQPIPTEPKPKS